MRLTDRGFVASAVVPLFTCAVLFTFLLGRASTSYHLIDGPIARDEEEATRDGTAVA